MSSRDVVRRILMTKKGHKKLGHCFSRGQSMQLIDLMRHWPKLPGSTSKCSPSHVATQSSRVLLQVSQSHWFWFPINRSRRTTVKNVEFRRDWPSCCRCRSAMSRTATQLHNLKALMKVSCGEQLLLQMGSSPRPLWASRLVYSMVPLWPFLGFSL